MGLSFKRNARGLLVSRRENQINDPACMGEKRAEFGLNVRRKKYRVRISLHGYLFNKVHMLVVEFFHVVGLYLAADLCYKYLKTTSGFYTLTSLNNGCPGLATLYCTYA